MSRTLSKFALVVALVVPLSGVVSWGQERDLARIYEEGRAAYYRGDLAEAVEKLQVVREAMPEHGATRAMLADALAKIGAQGGVNALEASYAKIVIPEIEMVELPVADAVRVLVELAADVTGGEVRPNVLLMAGAGGDTKISLTLSNIPLTEAIRYVARLAGLEVKYDKFAVVLDKPEPEAADE